MRIRLGSLWTLGFALVALQMLAVSTAYAQTVPAKVTLTWVLPTQNTDGSAIPATGQLAITRVQVFLSDATIPVTSTTPTAEVTPAGTTTTQTFSIPIGGTVFARIKACSVLVCSDLSTEVTKLVTAPKPGLPTNVTIAIQIGP